MKVVILSEIEQFCREHNTKEISLQMCRDLAVMHGDKGNSLSYKAGFARCNQAVMDAMAKAMKEDEQCSKPQ